MGSWCSSHVLVLRMPLILKMVSDKEYPRVHTNRQHVLAFICLVEENFFIRVRAISRQCLFMVTSSTMGVFPIAAIIGDVHPSYTTDCHSIVSRCKVSAKVQQDVQNFL